MKTIDKDVLAAYNSGIETNKLKRLKAGFKNTDVRGVIGPCWLVPNLDEAWKDEKRRESIMNIVRMTEKEEAIMGLSTHLLAISEKH